MKASKHLLIAALALCLLAMPPAASAGADDMRLLATYHVDGGGKALAWSPDGTRLAAASGNGALVLSASDGSVVFNLTVDGIRDSVSAVRWEPDGSRIFTSYSFDAGGYGGVACWNASTGAVEEFWNHTGGDCLDISPDGKWIAASGHHPGQSLTVRRISDGFLLLSADLPRLDAVAFSPDSRRLACLEAPRNLSVWNLSDGSHLYCELELNRMDATSMCWSPDGGFIMTGVEFRDPGMIVNIVPWESATGLGWGSFFCNRSNTVSLAWAPDGRLVMGQRDGSIFFTGFNRSEGWVNNVFLGCHTASVDSMAWSSGARLLASASSDGTVRIWGAPGTLPSKPRLAVALSAPRNTVTPGERLNLAIRVVDGNRAPVPGASVVLSSGAGGNLSAVAELGGGDYSAFFTAPAVSSNTTVTLAAAASFPGHVPANATYDILVIPAPLNARVPEPPVHVEDRSGLIVVFAGGAVIMLAAALAITEAGKYSGMVLFIPLYTRMKKTAVLDNFSRGQLHGYIVANPGVHMNAIRDRFGLSNGEVAYHLRVLEREGLVSSLSDGLRRRFYPGEGGPRERPQELTFAQNLLVGLMEKSPGITGTELARLAGTSPQVVNYHLKKLWRMELITMDRDGRVVRCFVRPERLGLFKRAAARTDAAEAENIFQETA
jgi:WD40 repeat protein/predicted transcriptional regulator